MPLAAAIDAGVSPVRRVKVRVILLQGVFVPGVSGVGGWPNLPVQRVSA